MKSWFLDTNICIYLMQASSEKLTNALLKKDPKKIKIPSIVLAELYTGAEEAGIPERSMNVIGAFERQFEVVPFDQIAAPVYARIRKQLEIDAAKVGANDLIIAATTIANDGVLVTNNEKEFSRIDSLETENWML